MFSCYCYHKKTSNKHMLVNAKCYFLNMSFFCLKLCVIFPSQSDLLNMTMYDLVYEDDQSELYSAMLSPANTVDTMHYSDMKGWSCVAGEIWFVAVIAVGLFSTLCHNISTTSTFVDNILQLEVTWTYLFTLKHIRDATVIVTFHQKQGRLAAFFFLFLLFFSSLFLY